MAFATFKTRLAPINGVEPSKNPKTPQLATGALAGPKPGIANK